MSFDSVVGKAAAFIKEHESFSLVSHSDADGICATAIIEEILTKLKKEFETHFLQQISSVGLAHLERKTSDVVIFIDMGSSHIEPITRLFANKKVMLIDHHQCKDEHPLLVNPVLFGMDGTKDACSASIAYEIASKLGKVDPSMAIIGAQADNQEPFQGVNKKILQESSIHRRKGARLYGVSTKDIVPLVAFSYDLKIPGITKNTRGTKELLQKLGLPLEGKFADLSDEQKLRLETELIKLSSHPEAEITHYTIEGKEGPLSDTREAATLINACGRMGQPEVAIDVLRGRESVEKALEIQRRYKSAIKEAHIWYGTAVPVKGEDYVIINAEDNIPASIAGTLCSVITRGHEVPEGTTVVCLARNQDGTNTTKVSSRALNGKRDLAAWLSEAAQSVGGEGGGHAVAAGAIIPSDQEQAFIEFLSQ